MCEQSSLSGSSASSPSVIARRRLFSREPMTFDMEEEAVRFEKYELIVNLVVVVVIQVGQWR